MAEPADGRSGPARPRAGDTAPAKPPPVPTRPRPVAGAPTERLATPPGGRDRTQPPAPPQAEAPAPVRAQPPARGGPAPAGGEAEAGIAGSATERERTDGAAGGRSGVAGEAAAAALEIRPPALEFEALVRARADLAAKLAAAPNPSGVRLPRPDLFAAALDAGLKRIREAEDRSGAEGTA